MGKFYSGIIDDLTLYARQLAWFRSVPVVKQEKSVASADKQIELSRAEKIQKNGGKPLMPDVGDAHYLITYWQDLGMVEMGAMGPVPLSAREINSW